ncbi:MAG: alpha-hydroxy-acid oxidizing protein [Lachnospiraceae bacterium]|nr:alpha-hydroxy-acid oxidizing protein [Lachnospiraceae bacterium]
MPDNLEKSNMQMGGGPGRRGDFNNGMPRPEGRNYSSDDFTRKYLDSLLVEMRLIDSDLASTDMNFFGHEMKTPVMFGVIHGYDKDGVRQKEQADAAVETGAALWIAARVPEEEKNMLAAVNSGARVVHISKPYRDNGYLIDRLQNMAAYGCVAVGSDIDHAYAKDGDYDHGFGPKSVKELSQIVNALKVPFIAKGVLSVQDALKCQEAGVAGILLSHHHGIMDCAVPPVMLLPEIRKAVGPDYPIYVDCCIDTGADAFKAMALGASGVCTARAAMKALPKGKEEMVRFMNGMTGELRHFMNRTSSPDIHHIDPSVIHRVVF